MCIDVCELHNISSNPFVKLKRLYGSVTSVKEEFFQKFCVHVCVYVCVEFFIGQFICLFNIEHVQGFVDSRVQLVLFQSRQ